MRIHFWESSIKLHAYTFYSAKSDFVSPDSIFSSWVIVIPEQGSFHWETTNDKGDLIAGTADFGDLVCIAPKMIFNRKSTSQSLTYHVLQWSFVDNDGNVNTNIDFPCGKLTIRNTDRLRSTLSLLKKWDGKMASWEQHRQVHLLQELLYLAWQTRINPPQISDPLMREAAQLLRNRAGEMFSISEISAFCGLSAVQFTRRFRTAYGINPIEFLTKIRLEMAQQMLIETGLSLDKIADRCGWSSGAYLSHIFAKHLATTPGHFRKTRRV